MNPVEDCRDVIPAIRSVYEQPDGGAGCCLHIVTDDGNLADQFVAYCYWSARERGHRACVEAAALLFRCSVTQRRKAISMYHCAR